MTLAKGGGGFIQIFTHNLLHHFIRIPTIQNSPLSHPLDLADHHQGWITNKRRVCDLHKIQLKTTSSVTQTGLLCQPKRALFCLFDCSRHALVAKECHVEPDDFFGFMVICDITLSNNCYVEKAFIVEN